MVNLEINGQHVAAAAGTTVLAAARQAGIFIPTLCDHPALKPAGNCRVCVVDVKGSRLPQSACTLTVSEGMQVTTETPALRASRQFVLGMLFNESTHVCPICPVSGGDCELQNAAYGQQMTHWPISPAWEPRAVDASATDFIFDASRCILCRRCVRGCAELVGNFTLGVEERGLQTRLIADNGVPLGASTCVACGTCVQLCPTGALFGRRDAYQGHAAKTQSTASVCVGCSVGCGVNVVTRDGRLVRIDGDWNSPAAGGLLCQVGRFGPLEEQRERILNPLVRQDGQLSPAPWYDALASASAGLQQAAGQVAGVISTRLPVESLAAFQQIVSDQLRGQRVTCLDQGRLGTGEEISAASADMAALRVADWVVVLGADLARDQQVLRFLIQRNLSAAQSLVVINAWPTPLDQRAPLVLRPTPATENHVLQAWLMALKPEATPAAVEALAAPAGLSAQSIISLARGCAVAQNPVVVFGQELARQPAWGDLVSQLAQAVPALRVLSTWGGANSRAAAQLGLRAPGPLAAGQALFVDLGDDVPPASLVSAAMDAPFLVVAASYESPLTALADVVLPVPTWLEQSGHYLNLEGRLQVATGALPAPAEVRPNLAVLAGLAQRLGVGLVPNWRASASSDRLPAVDCI
jgi:formate dehydrogenase major subunit